MTNRTEGVARGFIAALHRLENDQDLNAIVGTYTDDCEVSNVVTPRVYHGSDGARDFWSRYRGAFRDVHSTFRNVIVADGCAALEWTTEGTDPDGDPFRYDGVSILETDGDRIRRFRAFFDSVNLGKQMQGDGATTAQEMASDEGV